MVTGIPRATLDTQQLSPGRGHQFAPASNRLPVPHKSSSCADFLTLNQLAAALAMIEWSYSRALDDMPIVDVDQDALPNALALRGGDSTTER